MMSGNYQSVITLGVVGTTHTELMDVAMHFFVGILLIRKFSRGFYFRETSHMRSFVKIKSSQNGEITLSTTDIVKSCSRRDFLCRKYVF